MKMTSSTSSTSIIGVMFMSHDGLGLLALEDAVGAVVLMVDRHYSPPPACPPRRSVIRPMSSMPAARSSSIACMTRL